MLTKSQIVEASNGPVGTVDVVEFLRGRHAGVDFTLVLGGDTFNDLVAGKWRRGDDLVRMATFAIVPRKGVQLTWEPAQVLSRKLHTGLQHNHWKPAP